MISSLAPFVLLLVFAVVVFIVSMLVLTLARADSRRALAALPVVLVQFLVNVTAACAVLMQLGPKLAGLIEVWTVAGLGSCALSLNGTNAPDSREKDAAKELRARVMRSTGTGPKAAPVDLAEVRKRNEVEAEGKALS